MFNAKSDYAINKKNEGIVTRFADGTIHVYTLDDYRRDHPDKTDAEAQADFHLLKEMSDEDYRVTDRANCNYSRRTVSFENFERLSKDAVPSREDELIATIDHHAFLERRGQMSKQTQSALATLTEKQRRRYELYICEGLKVGEIVERERLESPDMAQITHQSVSESIKAAEKRINKFLMRQQNNPAK